jgi:Ion channel
MNGETLLRAVELVTGALVVWIVLRDLFVGVIVPRPARGRFRPSNLIVRWAWRAWRWIGGRSNDVLTRENRLGAFGPMALILLLIAWVLGLGFGYALMLYALRDQLSPMLTNFGSALYFSGVSMLTIGYGDIVPISPLARVIALTEGATGLGVVAVVISLLFSLYGSFQRREVLIVTLDALAGAPPSGVVLLENSLQFGMMDHLEDTFDEWKVWAAEVLESHLAYPILAYFRSSHDNESWVSAIGAVLDATVLLLSTIEEVPRGPAQLMYGVGSHLVEDASWFFNFSHVHEVGIERFEFDQACERLAEAGFTLTDPEIAWTKFSELRSSYAVPLNEMARYWSIPPSLWIGDRSYLPHRDGPARHDDH